VQIALARGARVLAISSGSELDAVREAGAHEVIDRAQGLSEQIRAVAPEGIAAALDVVAGLHPARTPQSAMAAQRRGSPIR
jgi:NADPH:quinone reductase-like Zn-dependent oxidoreductase